MLHPLPSYLVRLAPTRQLEAEFATAQLVESLERAGPSLIAPLGLATLLLLEFWQTPHRLQVLAILGTLCGLGLMILAICRMAAPYAEELRSAAFGRRVAAAIACILGATWATLPILLYPGADSGQRLFLVATLCGTIGNVCLLGSAWPVGIAYVTPLVIGGVLGIAGAPNPESAPLALLLLVAGAAIGFALDRNRKLASGRILNRIEVDDRAQTVDRLLLDFEAETANEWIWETDGLGRLQTIAPRMADAIGTEVADLEGTFFREILRSPGRRTSTGDGTTKLLDTMKLHEPFRNRVVEIETWDGLAWWRLSGKPNFDRDGRFLGYRGVGTDITASRTAEERIAYLANHDTCTGLPNRAHFHAHVQRECDNDREGALLSLDLDGFKNVNDRRGHAAGDEVLKEAGRRLMTRVHTGSVVARLGSDEFAIWCPAANAAQAVKMANSLIETLRAPFILEHGGPIDIGASVGIALTPNHATDADLLLVRANLSLHRAKAEGRGIARVFVEDYEEALVQRRTLEADIKLALARKEFELYYQPILDVGTGLVSCFEALIRWTSPTRGFVSPAEFIPVAEAAGLIVSIDRWALQQACRDATSWPSNIHIAVNVSPEHFRAADLVADVHVALRLSGLDPRRLCIEVTEGVFLGSSDIAVRTLEALRSRGIQIALDDFGTGYSSLSYLVNFPIDKIKIDQSFVRDLVDRPESRAIIDAILALARKLNLKVVAEGIETSEQALGLKLRRCDHIQGYLLSKAQPQSSIMAMLKDVPGRYRDAVPPHMESALGMALAMRKQAI